MRAIGTDATIAQHIETIVKRKYVHEKMQGSTKYLIPSALGIGLVEGYDSIGFERSLSRPQLRREVSIRVLFALFANSPAHRPNGAWSTSARAP